ncbi:MAG: protein kinase domain-containing protein [Longimicrobiales bacterium]
MRRDVWARVGRVLDGALDLSPADRDAFVREACGGDAALRRDVVRLLRSSERAEGTVLDRPAVELGAPLLERPDEDVVLDRYELVRRLGTGGMGVVFLAKDRKLDRLVALKFLAPHVAADADTIARFRTEARAASALDHPRIAAVHDIGEAGDGRPFIVMGYYEGETLRERIARGPLAVPEACVLAAQVAEGLVAAHAAGIVHRDIKPSNILLTTDGARILDFGVAKSSDVELTRQGARLGSIAYMSPEQSYGRLVDGRSDVWSLGVVLYEMLAGVRPFGADSDAVLLHAIRHDEPQPLRRLRPEAPQALARVVERCLRKEPAARYSSASALRAELSHADAVTPSLTVGPAKRIEPVRWRAARRRIDDVRRRVSVVGLLGLVGLLVAAGVIAERIVQLGGDGSGAPAGDALTLAVSPFTPVTSDSALEQLGRELAVTVAMALDEIEDLRTVDPRVVLAHATAAVTGSPRDRGIRLASAVGAGWSLVGMLTRLGAAVRVEARLYDVAESGIVARATTTGDPADLAALTDSVALALLRSLWGDRPVTSPSLGAIQTVRSVAALRAYLEGEALMARGDMPRAVNAFDRAFAADTTFWFAHWRSLYALAFYDVGPADTARIRRVVEHRHEFLPQDRILIEGWTADTLRNGHRLLRRAAAQFDSYWPAWYAYANVLVHRAPYLGTTYEDARNALERTVELNPDFSPAWEKLSWVVSGQRDTAATARALDALERTTAGVEFRSVERRRARFVFDLERFGLPSPDSLERVVDWILSEPHHLVTSLATGVGVPSVQLGLNAAILAREQRAQVIAALRLGNAYAWVSRGAWDSALIAIDRAANAWPEPMTTLDAYALAVTGAVLGVSPVDEAVRRRPVSSSRWRDLNAARLAWLDGILAYVREDSVGLARARDMLSGSSAIFAEALQESLAAFARDAAGDRAGAARELARLEEDNTNLGRPPPLDARYPFLVPVNRLVAARWLRETDGDHEAARLLAFAEATRTEWPTPMNVTFGSIGLVDRAEIAEAQGQTVRARSYYSRFIERHDMPVPELLPLVEKARAGFQRLTTIP